MSDTSADLQKFVSLLSILFTISRHLCTHLFFPSSPLPLSSPSISRIKNKHANTCPKPAFTIRKTPARQPLPASHAKKKQNKKETPRGCLCIQIQITNGALCTLNEGMTRNYRERKKHQLGNLL
jgi:hypothetical protein